MNQTTTIILVMLLLLSGCGRKAAPELQSFEGVTVATVQTPFSLMDETSLTETLLYFPGSEETPLPTALEPTFALGDTVGMSATPSQTAANPNQIVSTQITPIASATLGLNLTPLPPPGSPAWEGTWNIWYQNSTGAYISSVMIIQVSGIQFSGTATINGMDYTF